MAERKFLQDQVAIVTGAARGIGRAIALEFAKEGARLVTADTNKDGLKETSSQIIDAFGINPTQIAGDLTLYSVRQRLIRNAITELGEIDIFVINTDLAYFPEEVPSESNEKGTRRLWEKNYHVPRLLASQVAEHMGGRGQGNIIFISPVRARLIRPQEDYVSSVAALKTLAKTMAAQLTSSGVRINVIEPDGGAPEDVARAALILASDYLSPHVTGIGYLVSGTSGTVD